MRFRSPVVACPLVLAAAALWAAAGGAPRVARAQPAPAPARAGPASAAGHPPRVADGASLADVRAFAVARSGDRALVAYVQAGDPYARGALRLALLRASGAAGAPELERVGSDRTLAPAAVAVALEWDAARGGGAVAYVVPRPHRGEGPAGRGGPRRAVEVVARALESPVGLASLSAGDVMVQALDAEGAPVGHPALVFEENARVYRVALARADGGGWLVAWTGALSADSELAGTVRWSRVSAQGAARSFASETGFAGQTGDALFVLPLRGGAATLVFDGERCAARPGAPAFPTRVAPASPANAPRAPGAPPPPAPFERAGAPIACSPSRVWTAQARADGTTSPLVEGPAVPLDALALVRAGGDGTPLLLAPRDGALVALPVDAPRGRVGTQPARVLLASAPAASQTAPPGGSSAPDADAIARAPVALAASADGAGGLAFAALSPTRRRVAFGVQRAASGPAALALIAPGERGAVVQSIALAAGNSAPWLFAQTGDPVSGPLVFVDTARASAQPTPPESPWPGDDRLRALLLRARAARAEYTRTESGAVATAARPDAATNPALPGMLAALRRLRGQWEVACEPLLERARALARHGVDASVNELARETCEFPPEPGAVPVEGAPGAPAPAAP